MGDRRFSRRDFIRVAAKSGVGLVVVGQLAGRWFEVPVAALALPGGTLDPTTVPKYGTPMLVPPVMPRAGTVRKRNGQNVDLYEISLRQFSQQILPPGLPATTVWGYGAVSSADARGVMLHHAPSLTIEAKAGRPVRIRWINELVDADGAHLPHLLPVDPTLHWANPGGGIAGRDTRPVFTAAPEPYLGPVPMVTHVHGAVGVGDESDGYAEAWYLPAANDIPAGYATTGSWYDFFATKAATKFGASWAPGEATFEYPNAERAGTKWYHDHTLGMTRLNVYAGPAGFFLVRGGPDDVVLDRRTGTPAVLPGPAPRETDKFPSNKMYREVPIAIQDRSFNADGSLFYPDSRTFFDGIVGPTTGAGDPDDPAGHQFSPVWNPEFFGNTIVVNGSTWPFHTVDQRRHRFRFLNGCQSRFLILDFSAIPGIEAWQIGNEGGFLAAPVNLTATNGNRLLLGLAERADVIVDFTNVPTGNHRLRNVGPDEPFGGGVPGADFPVADPATTGQIMQFRVVPSTTVDTSTPPAFLTLPKVVPLPPSSTTRRLALLEKMGMGVLQSGEMQEGPVAAMLGVVADGVALERMWTDPVSETPAVGATETWEFYNATADAHPMHIHDVLFQVVGREGLVLDAEGEPVQPFALDGVSTPPESWETGFKDTVIAYPGQVTRVRATFRTAGQFVWHCHIVEHEDNEMMRPFRVGPVAPGQPT